MSTLKANAGVRGSGSTSTLRADIQREWGRFSADEVAALRNNDDLALNLSKKYRLDHYQASQIVEAFANGRKLLGPLVASDDSTCSPRYNRSVATGPLPSDGFICSRDLVNVSADFSEEYRRHFASKPVPAVDDKFSD